MQAISKNQATEQIVKHLEDRCYEDAEYEDAEYKDVYKPEECTYTVKFRVFSVDEGGDVFADSVLFVEPRK